MATVIYYPRPWEIEDAIEKISQGGSNTITNLLAAITADIEAKLDYVCPNCMGAGFVMEGDQKVRDTVCGGFGRTETQLAVQRTIVGQTDIPTVDQAPQM